MENQCVGHDKPLEDFDWSFNPPIKRSQIFDLATGQFIRQHRDILLLGPPGVGKSFLAQALGHAAIRAAFLVLYCSIFDMVRELQADQSPAEAQHTLTRYLKPDLLAITRLRDETFSAQECTGAFGAHCSPWRPGAQVALLQSLVSPTARADHHKA